MTEKEFREIVAGTKKAVLGAIRQSLYADLKDSIDDVAQETYIKIYRFISKNGMDSIRLESLSSWAYVIARNEALRMNEKHSRELKKQKELEEPNTNIHSFEIPEIPFERIPEPFSETLKLFVDGYSQKEISSILSIKPATVRSRLKRAKEKLKQILITEARI